VAKTNKQFV